MAASTTSLNDATAARRYGRIWVRRHFAKRGIKVTEQQARFIWKTGVSVDEYLAMRAAFGLGEAHKAAAPRKAAPAPRAERSAAAFAAADPKPLTGWAAVKAHISDPKGDSAWVATDGTFYRVSFAGHHDFSVKCHAAGIVTSTDAWGSYVGALEAIGWVHISGHTIRNREVKARLTAEQVSTLIAWAGSSSIADTAVRGFLA